MVTGEDIMAIIDQVQVPLIDGQVYKGPDFLAELDNCHELVAIVHQTHQTVPATLLTEAVSESQTATVVLHQN